MPNPILFLVLLFVVLAGPAILVVWGSISKNHWGINLHAVSCPRCSTALPLQAAFLATSSLGWPHLPDLRHGGRQMGKRGATRKQEEHFPWFFDV